mmetsp:Transcript_3914/g.11038  ORF Transcript_3914/g.11038 Transcript_3914/m.11038 type:complete len:81 (+) Transcript_3914:1161-1403(+)
MLVLGDAPALGRAEGMAIQSCTNTTTRRRRRQTSAVLPSPTLFEEEEEERSDMMDGRKERWMEEFTLDHPREPSRCHRCN